MPEPRLKLQATFFLLVLKMALGLGFTRAEITAMFRPDILSEALDILKDEQ